MPSLPALELKSVMAPTPPDFSTCDYRYGSNINPVSCNYLSATLLQGQTMIAYPVNQHRAHSLPMSLSLGNCMIFVEIAGPSPPVSYLAIPDQIRGMVDGIIDGCVYNGHGIGGFATRDIGKLLDYVTEPDTDIHNLYPSTSAFLTVSITAPRANRLSPGNYDPLIADSLAGAEIGAWTRTPLASPLRQDLAKRSLFFRNRALFMQTGGKRPWWTFVGPRAPGKRPLPFGTNVTTS